MFCRRPDVFLKWQISELSPACWICRLQSGMELMLVKNNKLQLSAEQRYAILEPSYERHPEPEFTADLRVLFWGKMSPVHLKDLFLTLVG